MKNAISWFEIPVIDIARAQKFYEILMDWKLELMEMGVAKMAIFPGAADSENQNLIHGALIQSPETTPSDKGAMIYFNAGQDLSSYLSRVDQAGGAVIQPKTSIGAHGFYATFKDTEGNIHALHSPN